MDSGRRVTIITLPVFGIPVRFESNSGDVLRVAEELFAPFPFSRDEGLREMDGPTPRIGIRVVPSMDDSPGDARDSADAGEARVMHTVRDTDLLRISGPLARGYADGRRRRAAVRIRPELLGDAEQFRVRVLESVVLFLVTRAGRHPVHAAAIVRGSAALLLAARSGTGKSTLAYAAMRAGFRVLSEDAVYLQLDPFRVWGVPRRIHLTPDSARFFPELASVPSVVLANGKTKLPVEVGEMAARPPFATRAAVCLLERGPVPGITRLSPDQVYAALASEMDEGFDHFRDRIAPRLRRLAEPGGWRFTLPPHPTDAIPHLHAMFDALG
jgi:hypothetical protein